MEVHRALLGTFVVNITAGPFNKKFSVLALEVRSFMEWLIKIFAPVTMTMYEITKRKADNRTIL